MTSEELLQLKSPTLGANSAERYRTQVFSSNQKKLTGFFSLKMKKILNYLPRISFIHFGDETFFPTKGEYFSVQNNLRTVLNTSFTC